MKTLIRIPAMILISLLYCYAMNIANSNTFNLDFSQQATGNNKMYFNAVNDSLLFHVLSTKTAVSLPVETPTCPIKNYYLTGYQLIKLNENLIDNNFFQYFLFSCNFLIRNRKKDILYPFQYFW